MENEVIPITQAAKYLNVHINTLRNWIKNNKIQYITTPGGHYRLLKTELIKLMQQYNFPVPEELISRKHNIYIIDDNQMFLDVCVEFFRQYPEYRLTTFTNGFDALLKIADQKPDLILLDIYLPKMDGYEFISRLKNNNHLKNIKIIAISNYQNEEPKTKAENIDYFHFKGDDLQLLLSKIKKYL
ncbi:MAG TPA: response regulator [Spirochaetota bacterium]|nr:response regulator [Spirochaetota bacterium]